MSQDIVERDKIQLEIEIQSYQDKFLRARTKISDLET